MSKFKLIKTKLKPYHTFYLGFFVIYCLAQYYFLYAGTGLGAFQNNIHFFSNAIGSISKRFLSDIAPFGLIFYLLYYYAKAKWVRYGLTVLFSLLFTLNTLTIGYYFLHRGNWQLSGLGFTSMFALSILLALIPAVGLGFYALKFKNGTRKVWLFKKRLFLILLILLTLFSPLIPIRYSAQKSLVTTQKDVESFFRLIHLEKSTLTHFYQVLTDTSKPTVIPDVSVFDLEYSPK